MTWSYDPADLATTPKDQVRYLIGDTVPDDQILQDEEINFTIGIEAGVFYAAARCCETISALFGRKVSTTVGSLKIDARLKYEHYVELRRVLTSRAAIGDCSPQTVAILIATKQAQEEDDSLVPPAFGRSQGSNPWAGPVDPHRTPTPGGVSWP